MLPASTKATFHTSFPHGAAAVVLLRWDALDDRFSCFFFSFVFVFDVFVRGWGRQGCGRAFWRTARGMYWGRHRGFLQKVDRTCGRRSTHRAMAMGKWDGLCCSGI